jgi:hypothetical protein
VRRKAPARTRQSAETSSAATMPPVGASEVVIEVPEDEVVVDEVAPDASRPKPAVRRRPAPRKPEKGGQ